MKVTKEVKVYHVPQHTAGYDLFSRTGVVVKNVVYYKDKQLSPNLPYKVQFEIEKADGKPAKFFAHLVRGQYKSQVVMMQQSEPLPCIWAYTRYLMALNCLSHMHDMRSPSPCPSWPVQDSYTCDCTVSSTHTHTHRQQCKVVALGLGCQTAYVRGRLHVCDRPCLPLALRRHQSVTCTARLPSTP